MESESGNHVKIPGIDIIPVKAFRMVPTDNDSGFLTMDGESIPVGPIQAQIVPSMLNLFVKWNLNCNILLHFSEKRGLISTFLSGETLQNLPYL